jgi:hypothetical protein
MIERDMIKNNEYDENKNIKAFEMTLGVEDIEDFLKLRFDKDAIDELTWNVFGIIKSDEYEETNVYKFTMHLPKSNLRLEMIASIGVNFMKTKLQDETSKKSELAFALSDMTNGMVQ